MDEPSSALDPMAEYELNKSISENAKGKIRKGMRLVGLFYTYNMNICTDYTLKNGLKTAFVCVILIVE